MDKKHFVHVFPTFELGGTELRACRVINGLGSQYRHTIIPMDKNTECKAWIEPGIDVQFLFPPESRSFIGLVMGLKKMLKDLAPDLLLTYNWGSIDSVLAARMAGIKKIIHIVGGFNPDEARRQKTRRVLARMVLLRNISALIVKSKKSFEIARKIWRIPEKLIHHIPNGIECKPFDYAEVEKIKQTLGLYGRECVFGTAAAMTEVKNLELLIKCFAQVAKDRNICLVIAGDGPQRKSLAQLARDLGVSEKIKFVGIVRNISAFMAALDVFVLSSKTEQMPNAAMEGMCAELPVVSTDVGDVREMVSGLNKRFIVPLDDEAAYANALLYFIENKTERKTIGQDNREKVLSVYPWKKCIESYENLFNEVLGK